ncbi:MAG: plasmid pRiA4b ORF-3 family protein [Oscillospiraceae bacterium]|nr:plasmid pRiA4b ORF-3 family protein [Oscillospiraceae bacterium]
MAVQIYTFKIIYAECDNKIWRTAAVSSNYTLAELGYMVLATFDTMAYHLFEMKYKGTSFFLTEEDFEDLPYNEDEPYDLLGLYKIGKLGMNIGDTIEMTYDFGCEQVFSIELLEISDMPKGHGRAYPKILDGAGRSIVDDMPAFELLEAIKKTDADGHSGIFYSSSGFDNVPEWDYRNYDINTDNCLLKGTIEQIRDGYENYEE